MKAFDRRRILAVIVCAPVLFAATLATLRPVAAAQDKKAAATFEVYQDKGGEHRWRLRAQNTQILATSGEGYKEKSACLAAIESVKKNAPDAPIQEQSAAK
jgi:uncharacterized protein